MKRQRITIGSILEIHINNEYYAYAQILFNACYTFFDYKSTTQLTNFTVLERAPVLFIIAVYNDVVTQGHWIKVGKMPIRDDYKTLPMKYIKDMVDGGFSLYNPNTGEISPATKEQCKGLEVAAVWEADAVEERITDFYNGKLNQYIALDLKNFDK